MKIFISIFIIGLISLTACNSHSPKEREEPETIFGIYQARGSAPAEIELRADSSATLSSASNDPEKRTGSFTCNGDSLLINWQDGGQVKTRILKKKSFYIFRVGMVHYKKSL